MKAQIAKIAITLFYVRGIKFTMSDLARDLSLSKSTLCEHFPSKDALIDYIVDQINEEAQLRFEEIVKDSNLTLPQKLKGILLIVPKSF
ncbi:TetR/AcrR family transcriptional regulator [Bacillus anthracis]|uniref:TetR/AcrR family transcriptional regulator n=1 Tax=Bacillus anthracis TaxID=1392 RepID=UPI003D1F8084